MSSPLFSRPRPALRTAAVWLAAVSLIAAGLSVWGTPEQAVATPAPAKISAPGYTVSTVAAASASRGI